MRKHGLRGLGLCVVAALGILVFAASSAQAEKGAHWNVNGSAISSGLLPTVGAALEAPGRLLSRAVGAGFLIECTGMEFEEAHLLTEGGSLGKIKFTGCETWLENTMTHVYFLSAACLPHTGAENDVILTKLLKDLIVLHEGKPLDRLEPEVGTIFVTIETGSECAIGSKIPVITTEGKGFNLKDCQGEGTIEKKVHLAEEGPLTELWTFSKTAEHKATIDGSANVFLTGSHEGLKFSGIPE